MLSHVFPPAVEVARKYIFSSSSPWGGNDKETFSELGLESPRLMVGTYDRKLIKILNMIPFVPERLWKKKNR